MSLSSAIPALQDELVSPKGTQEKNTCDTTAVRLQLLLNMSPKGAQEVKNTGKRPQIDEVTYQRKDFVSPDSCIFPYTEKHKFLK